MEAACDILRGPKQTIIKVDRCFTPFMLRNIAKGQICSHEFYKDAINLWFARI